MTARSITMILQWPQLLLCLLVAAIGLHAERVRDLEVSEGAPVGTRVGFIGDESGLGSSADSSAGNGVGGPPYLIVPVPGSAVDSDLSIEQTTGEIRTKVPLDRETRASYSLVAIPLSGENVRVVVRVLDENDNAPTFPTSVMNIEFPENTPRDVKRTLHPAKDLDLGVYNTQRYNIVSGNVNNAFRLSSHRERDGVLYLDLQINGFLDRETTSAYSLLIEALDGGNPPLRGAMTVNITIQDVNDNQPIFNQSRYFATIPENATVGTSVLQVFATDTDAGENGQVAYSINRRQSDREGMFRIDASTGLIAVNRPLDFETKEVHELVVVAKDHGVQPLETTAFVTIHVTDVNDNQPTINVIFLSDDATPKISESAQPGEFVARISVNDPDSKTEYSNVNVTLEGGDGRFGLTTRDNIIYLVIVSLPLDREIQPNYTLSVIATDTGNPPLHASRTFHLRVTDVNDNAPEFERSVYYANVLEVADPGTSVFQIHAIDRDEGNNSALAYSILDTPDTHSTWFQIDPRSGLITTRSHIDCETDPVPELTVIASDNGNTPLSSSATVLVTIHDVNDNEPIFDQSFYNVSVAENEPKGRCILKVSATDPDCGVNAMVNYTLGEGFGKVREFEVRSGSGEVCIAGELDFETRSVYEFPVIATDRGGLSTTAMVKIQLTDVNDNYPTFYPREYNVSLREGGLTGSSSPVVVVAATDPDSGRYGTVTYRIAAGNEAGLFRVDRNSGEIFVTRPSLLSTRTSPYHRLNISAVDGGGLRAPSDAEVFLSVTDSAQRPPIFERARYTFAVREDVSKNTVVGSVRATSSDSGTRSSVRYSIYSGDPDGSFTIDPVVGTIRTAGPLDHEAHQSVLLNVQAMSGDPPAYGHTQVNIGIDDVNDNAPEFDSGTVRISVPENVELGIPLYAAHARDRDSGRNGIVRYRLAGASDSASSALFAIDARTGHLTLARRLDYETAQRHSLVVVATDAGEPPLSANLSVLVEVQDVNDNPPVFERPEYAVNVLESLPVNSQVLQVTAVDLDTGNNARLTYRLVGGAGGRNTSSADDDEAAVFGIFPNSGWVYLRQPLDREARDRFVLAVAATDNGTPAGTATARITVTVLDANDNDPRFSKEAYEFVVEENLPRGAFVGKLSATDADLDANAAIRYHLIPGNTSFQVNLITGEVVTREPLDRETRATYELVAEARDQGVPHRSARVSVRVKVTDVNDNSPELVDPQEDVISVREEQPPGTEVVRVRAVDRDEGNNASVTYSLLKGRDSDGHGVFTVDPVSGLIRTKAVLDHEDRAIYRLAVAATDSGKPPRQTVRLLRVEVLDLNDNRPTFTSSSLVFRVHEDVKVGHIVGTVAASDDGGNPGDGDNTLVSGRGGSHVTYTLTSASPGAAGVFDIDRSSGALVVARQLDRELRAEYRLEVRALDTSASNNPQSSAVSVRVDVADVNDNAPHWEKDPVRIHLAEDTPVGSAVWNFTASDADAGSNGELRYSLVRQWPPQDGPSKTFTVDPLTGTLTLNAPLDYETLPEYTLIVRATDQASNRSERLSTSVTAIVLIKDANDNDPVFVAPAASTVLLSDTVSVGTTVCHVVAADKDSGENGRVTYVLASGNDEGRFAINYDTGALTLSRLLVSPENKRAGAVAGGRFSLNITASDHGLPSPRHATRLLHLVVQGTKENPPRFVQAVYHANVSEDAPMGTYVVKVMARSLLSDAGGGNLTYHIPAGVADDRFKVDSRTGVISVRAPLDRETVERYTVPVYVTDSHTADGMPTSPSSSPLFDVTTVSVRVTDVNDHAPEFRPGSCYRLSVPENSDLSVIHTVVATDKDSGPNGEVTYSITAGNIGNKFSIDLHSGQLVARPLDREAHSRYWLVVTAQDRGNPVPLQGSCNVSVFVEDQNDNDPRFSQPRYSATVPEDVPPDTPVLTVQATDADLGENARIVYSLANESHWLFRIDNKSGVITTAGVFDHEQQSSYRFLVVATDGGRYDARSQRVPVQINIGDVNDNKPTFSRYPFTAEVPAYTQPGHNLLRVTADDADQGTNAEVVFSFVNEPPGNKFRINPNTGIVTASSSLAAESGRLFHLEVLARDKGNPPQSSTGLIEIRVGDPPEGAASLRFQNASYVVHLQENAPAGKEVVQVSAVRTDGRRQRITYSFGTGNEDGSFEIHPQTGVVRVRNSRLLDYELRPRARLVIVAQADPSPLYGYCELLVLLLDQNDNAPRFTQPQYSSAVWEGNNKGTFVMQVSATDADQDANSRVLYHIVDGNHDNAFVIEPPFSGLVKTNIVLDREIRDAYRLTVIATDEGVPQLTGTATLRINIVDVNDNQPTFPPHSVISISEGTEVGSVLTTMTANDVDTNPALTYSFSEDDNNGNTSSSAFSIDRFSGKVTLVKRLDFETRREYRLRVTASDTAHTANTVLTIRVTDVNDNPPVFLQPSYQASLPEGSEAGYALLTVNATDADTGDNARIRYSLQTPVQGFTVDHIKGTLFANRSAIAATVTDVQLVVVATDSGQPPLSSVAAVRVRVSDSSSARPRFTQDEYRVHIREDAPSGTTVARIASDLILDDSRGTVFSILDGNVGSAFQIMSASGDLILLKTLDRETEDSYTLRIVAGDRGTTPNNTTAVSVFVTVDDANDNAPVFQEPKGGYEITVSEGAPIGQSILRVTALDTDQPGTLNSDLVYDVTSGDDNNLFTLDPQTGVLSVRQTLDYDAGVTDYTLVIRASDSAKLPNDAPLSTVTSVRIHLQDENDNEPRFPVAEYLEFVGENEPAGTAVFTARATDMDKGEYGKLNYSLVSAAAASGYTDVEDSWKLFRVDSGTGVVTTNSVFDYEARNRYAFTLKASDVGGRTASVRVRVEIESRDEFHPQFTERTYRFVLAGAASSGHLPVGYIVGHVAATDRDKGPDGRVVYQLTTQHPYFKINRTTGAVMVKKKLDNAAAALEAGRDISLVVTASSGRQGSLTNMTVVEIALDPLADRGTNLASSAAADGGTGAGGAASGSGSGGNNTAVTAASGGLADWALGLLIALILIVLAFGAIFLFLHVRNRRHKKVNKPALSGGAGGVGADGFVDPSAFDTIPIRGGAGGGPGVPGPGGPGQGPNSQFGPPKYDEIPPYVGGPVVHRNNNSSSSNSGAATTSELSGSEQSGSSGRGSAEDGEDVEDEEIRMINEGPLQRDSGIHRQGDDADDDNLSDVSVHNTQEYLARLGIVDTTAAGGGVSTGAACSSSRRCSDTLGASGGGSKEALLHHQGVVVPIDGLHMFDEEGNGEADITNLIYAKLNDVGGGGGGGGSDRGSTEDGAGGASGSASGGVLGAAVDHVMGLGGFADVQGLAHGVSTHQPSMTGSLSSIVHSEEELTGSYNWDYLLDWGPQYQPLAHVFSEIARLKDDTASVQSTASGTSSSKGIPGSGAGGSSVAGSSSVGVGKSSLPPHPPAVVKTVPPPLLTSVAPRSIAAPVLASRTAGSHPASHHASSHHQQQTAAGAPTHQLLMLPRSPISHDASGAGFSTSAAMSPSFSPSLSPLATRSPSISPLVTPGVPTSHHVVSLPRQVQQQQQQQQQQPRTAVTETELRI